MMHTRPKDGCVNAWSTRHGTYKWVPVSASRYSTVKGYGDSMVLENVTKW